MSNNEPKLTEKQKRFADEYLIDLNATSAYRRAYGVMEENVAAAASSRLLRNVKVAEYIQTSMDKRAEESKVSAKYVLDTIIDTIERCKKAEPVRDRDGNEIGEYKFDSNAVLKGAELLGKHLKLFTEKVEHTGNDGKPIDLNLSVTFVSAKNK